jgi:hypothetical protein
MLGSSHDGERAAAGAQWGALIRQLNLQWDDVITPPVNLKPFHNLFAEETPRPGGETVSWCAKAEKVAKSFIATPWERRFAQFSPSLGKAGSLLRPSLREVSGVLI